MKRQFVTTLIITLTAASTAFAIAGKEKGGKPADVIRDQNESKLKDFKSKSGSAAAGREQAAKSSRNMEQALRNNEKPLTEVEVKQFEADFMNYFKNSSKDRSVSRELNEMLEGSGVTKEMISTWILGEKTLPRSFVEAASKARGEGKSYEEAAIEGLMATKGVSRAEALRMIREACKA